MRIAVITYPVSPYRGSEFAVSWNYIEQMSSKHELYVFYGTSGGNIGNVDELKEWLQTHRLANVHFVNVRMPNDILTKILALLRKLNYKAGSYLQYKYWHKQVYRTLLAVKDKEKIDIVHYLNPIGFKEPSECWRITGVPYVWGPVQGVENRPFCLYRALGWGGVVDALCRLVVHNAIMLLGPKIRKAVKRADCVFAATPNTVKQMNSIFGKETIYLPENGIVKMNCNRPVTYIEGETLRIVWCGAVCYRKGLILLLDALTQVGQENWHLDVIGSGKLLLKLKSYSEKHGLAEKVTWHGNIPRKEVFDIMQNSHLHVISSLGEATTTVLWEAMSYGVPTMTLDHCGMAGVVCEKCGIKIPIHSYRQVVGDMAKQINNLIENPNRVNILSSGVLGCSKKFMWGNRIKLFDEVYKRLAEKYSFKVS